MSRMPTAPWAGVAVIVAGAMLPLASAALPAAQPDDVARGEQLFARNCRPCHAPGMTGYFMLARRVGKQQADLAARHGVAAPFVTTVVRQGLNSMPHIPRGSVSDAELAQIIAYLNRPATP